MSIKMASRIILLVLLFSGVAATDDWLVTTPSATSYVTVTKSYIEIGNGLIYRRFSLMNSSANAQFTGFATTDFRLQAAPSRGGEQSLFRRATPEAVITLDGVTYDVGGLKSTGVVLAYCNRTELPAELVTDAKAFSYNSHSISEPVAPFPWTAGTRGSPPDISWPPRGKTLSVVFTAPSEGVDPRHAAVEITLTYEIYDGVPLLSKWLTVAVLPAGTHSIVETDQTVKVANEGWAVKGGVLEDGAACECKGGGGQHGACFKPAANESGGDARAVYGVSAASASFRPMAGQTQVGFTTNTSEPNLPREEWDFLLAADGGGIYAGRGGPEPFNDR
jgi:hypothetical protein